MATICIIERDQEFAEALSFLIRFMGHGAECASSLAEGREKIALISCDLVFLGMDLLEAEAGLIGAIRANPPSPEVIVISADESPDLLDQAFANGAWDSIRRPLSKEQVRKLLLRVLRYREERGAFKPPGFLCRDGIIGKGPRMSRCLGMVEEAARCGTPVLISGETGTGKELFARAVHASSPRAANNFVTVDCASLPANLVESVLFGHEKGAFTGAESANQGLVRQADGGTLFLDELGELPLEMQKKFLRVLQEQRFRPVGGSREIESDFRLVAATNRNLEQLARERLFREDLLFRVRVFTLDLPPLRERTEDIAELVMARLVGLCRSAGLPMKNFCADFLEVLSQHDWPGNVRELHNAVETAFVRAFHEPTLFSIHLPPDLRIKVRMRNKAELSSSPDFMPPRVQTKLMPFGYKAELSSSPAQTKLMPFGYKKGSAPLFSPVGEEPSVVGNGLSPHNFPSLQQVREEAIRRAEYRYFSDLLQFAGDDRKKAAETAEISRSRLYHFIEKYGLKR